MVAGRRRPETNPGAGTDPSPTEAEKLGMKLRKCAVICADSERETGSDLAVPIFRILKRSKICEFYNRQELNKVNSVIEKENLQRIYHFDTGGEEPNVI